MGVVVDTGADIGVDTESEVGFNFWPVLRFGLMFCCILNLILGWWLFVKFMLRFPLIW